MPLQCCIGSYGYQPADDPMPVPGLLSPGSNKMPRSPECGRALSLLASFRGPPLPQ